MVLDTLQKSAFRRKFKLNSKYISYIKNKKLETIYKHADHFLRARMQKRPHNDGRQTPWSGHPVFIAQHATATCCRGCIERWHKISKNRVLNEEEISYLQHVIMEWIQRQL